MAIKSFLSEGGFSVGSVGATPVEVIDSSGNVTAQTISGTDLTLSGNLTVNGSTVTVNSTTVTVDDPIFTIGGDTAPASNDSKDRGIEFRWHNGTAAKVGFFGYDNSTGKFIFIADATNTSEVFSGTAGQIDLSGSIVAGGGITFDASTGTITNNGVQSIAGTANQVFVNGITNAVNGNVTLTLPQNIHTGATPTFSTLTLGGDVLTFSGSGVTAYTNDTARIYNQAGVGPTINGNIFQVRTGATGSLALNIGNNQNSTFSGIVTVNGSGSSIISDSLGIGAAAYYGAKFTVDGNAIGYSWGITNARGGHTTSISNPDGGTTSSNIAFKVANSSGTTLIQSTYGGAITIPGATTISNTLTVNTSPVTLSNSGANPNFRAIDGSIITKLQSQSVGDTTGAIGTESNHTLKLITNNAARVTIDTSGNVGVGTTSPTSLLHIYGGYPHVTLQNPTAGSGVTMLFVDGTTVKHTIGHINSSSKLQFGTGGTGTGSTWNGSIAMTIDGSQNIGIGTTNPSYKLEVFGDTGFRVVRTSNQDQHITLTGGDGSGVSTVQAAYQLNLNSSSASYPMTFQIGGSEKLRISSAGNVGIGTTTPGATLEISKAGATDNRFIRLTDTSASGRSWDLINRAGNSAGNFGIYDNTAGAYRFWIDTSGNIGINTTSPSNKLDVNGSIRTNDWYYVDGSGFGMYNNATAMYFSTNSNSRWNFSSGQSSIGLRLYSGGHNNTWRAHFYGDSTGQGFLDSAENWQMYVDSSNRLRVYSGIYNAETGIRILNPGGAAYVTQTSTVTGAFKIRLPVDRFKSNTMMRMTVKIYQYSTGQSSEFEIGGYNYSDAGANWYNVFAEQKSDALTTGYTVRFGNDGTANCIWIGETTTTWSYPQVYVTEFQGGYSGTTGGWASGWSISAVTTFDTVTQSRSASQVVTANNISTVFTNTGNISVGGALTVNKVSGISTITFPAGFNDPGYIQHEESSNNNGIMRFSVGDDNDDNDYFTFGNNSSGYAERFRLFSNGRFRMANNIWHQSLSDGLDRTYFSTSGSTFYKGHGSAIVHEFRNGSDQAAFQIYNDLTSTFLGSIVKISNSSRAQLQLINTAAGGKTWGINSYSDGALYIGVEGVANYLTFTGAGNATFSGSLTASGTVYIGNTDASLFRIGIGGIALSDNGTRQTQIYCDSGGSYVRTNDTRSLYLGSNTVNVLTLDSSQKITVGSATNRGSRLTMPNDTAIAWNNAANTADDVAIYADSSNSLNLRTASANTLVLDSSKNATFAGNVVTVAPASGSAGFILKRASTSAGSTVEFYTTSSLKWYMGLRGLVNDNLYLFNNGLGANALTLDIATSNATFAGSVTVGSSGIISWTSGARLESPSDGVVKISSNNGSYPGYLNVAGIQSWDGVIALSVGTGTGHLTANANLTVTGNLTVNGTTTTVNSTVATIKDPIVTLGGGNAGTAASSDDNKDRGIEFKWHNGTAAKTGFFGFDDSTGYFTFIPDATNTSEVFSGTVGDIDAGVYRGTGINVTGAITESSATDQAITLNATDNSWKYIGFQWSGTRKSYFGINSSGAPEWGSDSGSGFQLVGSSSLSIGGNAALHAGNYNSYALPLTGGTLTGDLRFNIGGGYGRVAYADNYHGLVLRGYPNNAAGAVTAADVTCLIQHSGDFRFYRTNGTLNNLVFQVNNGVMTQSASGTVQHVLNSTDSGSKEIVFQNNGSTVGYVWHASTYVAMGGGNVNNSLFVNGGYVGIGVIGTATKLEVYDSTNAVTAIRVNNPNTGTAAHSSIQFANANSTNGAGVLLFGSGYTTSGLYRQDGMYIYTNRGGGITLNVETNNPMYFATNNTERMRIDGSGNLGVGTGSGAVDFKTTIAADITMSSDVNPGTAQLSVQGSSTPGKRMLLGYDTTGNGYGFIKAGNYGVTWTTLSLQPNGGNVSIGTTSNSYKLHVAGDIYASSGAIRVNSTNPFYFESYGGGWFMQDTTWIRSYNSKNVWAGSGIIANDAGFSVGYGGSTPPSGGVVISGNVGIGLGNGVNPTYKLEVSGSFAATTKSFVIKHPTKEGKKLRYGSLEGPENGVYVRGRLKGSNTIDLPDYWEKLVDPDSITVNLTPVGKHQKLYVESVSYKHVVVEKDGLFSGEIDCFYTVFAERIDVEKLQVEIDA